MSAFALSFGKSSPPFDYLLSYNIGRILSYSFIGGLVGSLGYIFKYQFIYAPSVLKLFSGIFLVLLGSYIGGWWRGLVLLEHAGQSIWRHIAPISQKLMPIRSSLGALCYGVIWGWLPCGLVYSTLNRTWILCA